MQFWICLSSLASLAFSSCQVCFLGQLGGTGLLDLGPQLPEGLVLRVVLEHLQLGLGLLE